MCDSQKEVRRRAQNKVQRRRKAGLQRRQNRGKAAREKERMGGTRTRERLKITKESIFCSSRDRQLMF